MNTEHKQEPASLEQAASPAPRARYVPPGLKVLGDLRAITLGGSLGASESGPGGRTRKPIGT